MPKTKNIFNHFRHLMMSVTLLWALMLNGQEVVAYSSPAKGSPQKEASKLATAPAEKKAVVKQKVSLEATTSFVALNLHQAVLPTPLPPFAPVKDEALPAYSARAPGAGFIAQLFPITIQPNAP